MSNEEDVTESPEPLVVGGIAVEYWTHLVLDAMYFRSARRALEQARIASTGVDEARAELRRLKEREVDARRCGDQAALKDVSAQIQDVAEPTIAYALGSTCEAVITVHTMAAATLEAHINEHAAERLGGKEAEYFDRLPLEAKWLFLPKMLGKSDGFDAGAQPFQGFANLVKTRNQLLHHKPRRERWKEGQHPDFLFKLGLTVESADASVASAAAMVRKLSAIFSVRVPYWLDDDRVAPFNHSLVFREQ
jgi:hypothetical protein